MSSPFQRAFSSKSPLNEISQRKLNRLSAKQDAESLASSTSGNVGAPGDPGTEINYSDPKKFAGDDEGMLKSGLGTPEGTIVENDSMINMNSPLDKAGARGNHDIHMQAGTDNSGNSNAKSSSEYWRVHQQQDHHRTPPKGDEKKKLKA
jgi:hypothetical protein